MFFASVILLIFVYHIIYAEFDHVMILFSCCLGQVSLVKAILTIMGKGVFCACKGSHCVSANGFKWA